MSDPTSPPNPPKREVTSAFDSELQPSKKVKLEASSPPAKLHQTTLSFAPKQPSKPAPFEETPVAQVVAQSPSAPTEQMDEPPNEVVKGFNAAEWLEKLPVTAVNANAPSTRDLLTLEANTLDPSWLVLLKDELTKSYFLNLKKFLWTEGVRKGDKAGGKVYPPARDVYAWSRYTPLHKVRVVIIGQDPYHGEGQAHGLCFSVQPGVKIPPSLRNIYKELAAEYPSFKAPTHGSLISWATNGVLLLNTSLTVAASKAGSHSGKGWETFTDRLISLVDEFGGSGEVGKKGEGVVFLAWGAWAAKRVEKLDRGKHCILECAHPSPLSARRGFEGCGHFKKANEWIENKYGAEAVVPWTKIELTK